MAVPPRNQKRLNIYQDFVVLRLVVIPTKDPVLAFARKHGGEVEESISIASPKANQKIKLAYLRQH
jgi:hypothetical protein